MLASTSPFLDTILVVLGGFLAGVVGIVANSYGRKRQAVEQFLSDIGRIMTIHKDTNFHTLSTEVLRESLWRVRPYLNAKKFTGCMNILADYQKINYYELAEQKEAALVWSLANDGKSIDDRITEYLDRFAKEIE
jgi:hypothetical protein